LATFITKKLVSLWQCSVTIFASNWCFVATLEEAQEQISSKKARYVAQLQKADMICPVTINKTPTLYQN
jgi:hypothetical protein